MQGMPATTFEWDQMLTAYTRSAANIITSRLVHTIVFFIIVMLLIYIHSVSCLCAT